MSKSSIAAVALVLVMVVSAFAVATANVAANKGTRDTYGYGWTDSKSPAPSVAFNWIEINSTGTLTGLTGDDDMAGPFPIGFDFTFYGNRYSAFNISTNGYIQFNGMYDDLSADSIPSTWGVNNFVALYWHDMYVASGAEHGIYYETRGVAPDRQLVVEFLNFSDLSYSSTHMTLEIVLYENGEIWMNYLYLNGRIGSNAGIGIENSDGSDGCEYSYYTASLQDAMSIKFAYSPILIGPAATAMGPPGTTLSYSLTVQNRLAVSDSIAIQTSGVEGWTVAVYDSSWNPLIDTDFDTIPDTGTIASMGSAILYVNVTVPVSPVNPTEYTTVNASAHTDSTKYDVCVLTSQEAVVWFDPPHSDYATDSDLDGDYNTLTVDVLIYVRVDGWYYVYGDLYTDSGWFVQQQSGGGYFVAGTQTVSLTWNGWFIYDRADDGQLRLDLEVYDSVGWDLQDEDTYYTASYVASDFMQRPIAFNSPHSTDRIDLDSDGLYEILNLHTNTTVRYDGTFRVDAYLYDSGWNYVTSNSSQLDLAAGDHTFDIGFSSIDIRTSGAGDGPYNFQLYLYAFVRGSWWYMEYDTHQTPAYPGAEFKAPAAYFEPPHSESVADINSDGLYEWLYIYVGVNVTVAGEYTISGDLSAWDYIDTDENHTYLGVGSHIVQLSFPGFPIRYESDSDDYDVDLTLTGDTGILDTDYYETDWYWYTDFATAPGWFVTTECSVEDLDGDGLYDFLLVNATVNVTMAGLYEVHADLYDWWGDLTCDLTNRTQLAVGETVFHFAFPGWMISVGGEDPDEVYLYLYDEDGRQMDTTWFYTPSWYYYDFETVPAYFGSTGNTLSPDDTDLDGVNETMVMVMNVTVETGGYYWVYGMLYDSAWTRVGYERVRVWLPAGNNSVTITFPGWLIRAIGDNGTFWEYAYLYDDDQNQMDSWDADGGAWYNDFDPAVPRIVSSWAATTPTIDGLITSNEWAAATVVAVGQPLSTNQVGANMLVMNNATHLFISFDVWGDTSEDASDSASLAFDTGNDEVGTDGMEDQFTQWGSGTQQHYDYDEFWADWYQDCSPLSTTNENHTGLMAHASFGHSQTFAFNHRTYEFAIPLALLGATMGDVLGFETRSHVNGGMYDAHNWTQTVWPLMSPTGDLATFGELVLAEHIVIPPPVTAHAMAGTMGGNSWYTSAVAVTLTATGGDGGVDHTEFSLNDGAWTNYTGAIVISANGTHSLRYRSTDAASQEESIKTVTVNIDQIAPVTTAGKSGTFVWLNATDSHSGVASIAYRIDGGSWTTYTGMFNVTGSRGMHTVEYFATDRAGCPEAMKSIQVEVTSGTTGGISELLSNPILWIILIAAIAAVLVLVVVLMKRRKGGQQPVMYPAPGQPMPAPQPEYPFPPPGPPPSG